MALKDNRKLLNKEEVAEIKNLINSEFARNRLFNMGIAYVVVSLLMIQHDLLLAFATGFIASIFLVLSCIKTK